MNSKLPHACMISITTGREQPMNLVRRSGDIRSILYELRLSRKPSVDIVPGVFRDI